MSKEGTQIRPEKQAMAEAFRAEVEQASYVLMTDFSGLNMAQMMELRNRLREAGGKYRVVRNRLLKKAVSEPTLSAILADMTGPTAVVTGDGDGVDVARALLDFVKKNERLLLKTSLFDGRLIGPDDLRALGNLPDKPVLQAMLLGVLAAPMTKLAGVFQQKIGSLVYVHKAAEDKKRGATEAAPEA